MEIKPIKTQTKLELFVDEVEKWIFEGTLQPGDKLPSERELAQKMQISRSVVNRGLSKLAGLKLININPQSGSVVNDYFSVGTLDTLNALLSYRHGHYDLKLLRSIYSARKLIETEIIRLACLNCQRSDAAKLNNLVDDLINSQDDQTGTKIYEFFHQLAVISNNEIYPLLIGSFQPVYLILGRWNSEHQGKERIVNFNHQLVKKIAAHDKVAAIQVYQSLVKWSLENLLS